MSNSSLRISGDDLLHLGKNQGKESPNSILVRSPGGGMGRAGKKVQEDRARADQEKAAKEAPPTAEMILANTPRPEPVVDRTTVKITNLHWKTTELFVGDTAQVGMDVLLPEERRALTRITCTVEYQLKNSPWKPCPGSATCHVREGKAECDVSLIEPPRQTDGMLPASVTYRVLAKHAYSKTETGPAKEAGIGSGVSGFDSVIYYCPADGKYLLLDSEADYNALLEEFNQVQEMVALAERVRAAEEASQRTSLAAEMVKRVKAFFGEAAFEADANPVQEHILVRKHTTWKNPPAWAFGRVNAPIAGIGPKGKWYNARDPVIAKNLKELLERAPGSKQHSPFFENDLCVKLFETKPLVSKDLRWLEGGASKQGKIAGQSFHFSKEGCVGRLLMKWDGAEGKIDLKERKLHIGTGGSIKAALLEGKAEGEIPLPEKGLNLITFLKTSPYLNAVLERNGQCQMRIKLGLSGSVFAGISLSTALTLPEVDLSREKLAGGAHRGRHAEAGVQGERFVGAKVDTGLTVALEWARNKNYPFESLAEVGGVAGLTAGYGGEFAFKLEYRDGFFYFHCGAEASAVLGIKGGFTANFGLAEGYEFASHLFKCMDFHFVEEVNAEAFKAYKDISFTLMAMGETVFTAEKKFVKNLIGEITDLAKAIPKKIEKIKENLQTSTRHSSTLNNVPPEALGQALQTIMKTREQSDFRMIMDILYSTVRPGRNPKEDPSARHKLECTLRCATEIQVPAKDGPGSDALKEQALKEGIERIEDFGNGFGYPHDKNGNAPKKNLVFLGDFNDFLIQNGVK